MTRYLSSSPLIVKNTVVFFNYIGWQPSFLLKMLKKIDEVLFYYNQYYILV